MSHMNAMNKQFAVLGLGRFGTSIVRTLSEKGCSVLGCDNRQHAVQDIADYATHAVVADVTDEHDLAELGIGNFDVVVIAIGGDFEATLMAAMYAKEKGVGYVMTKARNAKQKKILKSIGVDRVVLPELEMGERIAINLLTTNVLDFINISDDYGIVEISPRPEWVDKTLRESNIRATTKLNVVAVKRHGKIMVAPHPDDYILRDDILVVLGETQAFSQLMPKR